MADTKFVKLSPVVKNPVHARVTPIDDTRAIYKVFVGETVYEVSEQGFEDLKKYNTDLKVGNPLLQVAFDQDLSYTILVQGCKPCAKRKNIDPESLKVYRFDTFVETDESGNILDLEKGTVTDTTNKEKV